MPAAAGYRKSTKPKDNDIVSMFGPFGHPGRSARQNLLLHGAPARRYCPALDSFLRPVRRQGNGMSVLTATRCSARARGSLTCALLALAATCLSGCGAISHAQNAEGVTMYQQAYYQGALERFHQSLASNPNNPDAYYNLGATYHRLGRLHNQKSDIQQAESYYHQCLDRDPNHQDCYRGLAVLLVEDNRNQEAFQLVQNWEQRNPSGSAPKIELARLYEESGNKDAARQQLQGALEVEPNNARAYAALGKLREESGDSAQALANYQRSLAINHYQPQVAQRVAALQSMAGGIPATAPGGTRLGATPTQPIR
jgi:tetratricopeptide (TPR) repeat protein